MFSVGHVDGYITLENRENEIIIRLYRDLRPQDILTSFQIAQSRGWIEPHKNVLIDLREFVGSVDWETVRELRSYAPWAQVRGNGTLCAYLMAKGDVKAWLVTIVGALYPGLENRVFSDEAAALSWLKGNARVRISTLAMGPHSG